MATGVGEPFPDTEASQDISFIPQVIQSITSQPKTYQSEGLTLSTNLDLDKLQETLIATDEILEKQNRTMTPKARGEFTVMIYSMFIGEDAQPFNKQLLQDCVFSVETILEQSRRTMSHSKKTLLIIAIYTMYIDSLADIEELLITTDTLLRRTA